MILENYIFVYLSLTHSVLQLCLKRMNEHSIKHLSVQPIAKQKCFFLRWMVLYGPLIPNSLYPNFRSSVSFSLANMFYNYVNSTLLTLIPNSLYPFNKYFK